MKDIEAIKTAVLYDYSNGLVEDTVNKIKVVKRIMYGRCGFDSLKKMPFLRFFVTFQLIAERTKFTLTNLKCQPQKTRTL